MLCAAFVVYIWCCENCISHNVSSVLLLLLLHISALLSSSFFGSIFGYDCNWYVCKFVVVRCCMCNLQRAIVFAQIRSFLLFFSLSCCCCCRASSLHFKFFTVRFRPSFATFTSNEKKKRIIKSKRRSRSRSRNFWSSCVCVCVWVLPFRI